MTLQDLLAALETGLPNRQADLEMWRMGRARPRFETSETDVVPNHVLRVTFDASAALATVDRVAPYASWRLAYDRQRNRHVFEICGQRGEAPIAATAICIGLVKHCIARGGHKSQAPAMTPPEALASVVGFGLTPSAMTLALALKNHDTTGWDDDRWCSAISTLGVAPRDVLPELDRIKTVVATLRGETP